MTHQDHHHPTHRETPAAATKPAARAVAWERRFEGIDAFVAHAQKSARLEPVVYELNRGSLRNE